MKQLTLGMVAHVDAGKTTLSESLLYTTGTIKHQGRVDHKDTFLDYNTQERERGITIKARAVRLIYTANDGKDYVFIDTAGLRRKSKIKEELERYSIIRTVTAVERADVVLVVIDATEGVTEQDAKIAGIAHERGKGIIIVVNKWDAIEKNDKTIYKHTNRIREVLSFMPYAEIVFISAKTGLRISRMFETIDAVIENQTLRIQTGVLNEILSEAVAMQQPPSDKGKRLRLYYITQVAVKPPTFVIFVNDKELMHFSYTRYIENKVRDAFGFRGTPLKFIIRERGEKS